MLQETSEIAVPMEWHLDALGPLYLPGAALSFLERVLFLPLIPGLNPPSRPSSAPPHCSKSFARRRFPWGTATGAPTSWRTLGIARHGASTHSTPMRALRRRRRTHGAATSSTPGESCEWGARRAHVPISLLAELPSLALAGRCGRRRPRSGRSRASTRPAAPALPRTGRRQ